jgi:hypothetical protein
MQWRGTIWRAAPTLRDGQSCQTPQSHEIQSGDGVAFDEFKTEQDDHADKPRHLQESPTSDIVTMRSSPSLARSR